MCEHVLVVAYVSVHVYVCMYLCARASYHFMSVKVYACVLITCVTSRTCM
jgi:hypothetical protein